MKFCRPCATCTTQAWDRNTRQYLRPTLEHYPVAAYITPEKFDWYRLQALDMGFSYCASAPMVRSSYLADEALGSVRLKRQVSAKA